MARKTRQSCGWSWDATRLDDGSLNEVNLVLEAPRQPNTAVTISAKPGASPAQVAVTTTDALGYASMRVRLTNDKRDWSITLDAQFPDSSCDTRQFSIVY